MNNQLLQTSSTLVSDPIVNQNFWEQLPEDGNVLTLVNEKDPILKEKSIDFDFEKYTQEEINQLVLDMGATMRYNRGIGLSAVQFGRLERVFVIEIGENLPLAIFNPLIVDQGPNVEMEEGCLSFPKLVLKIKRPSFVKVRFRNFNNDVITHRFEGLSARCVLHEYAHLEGKTMQDEVSKLQWELATKKRYKHYRI